MSDENTKSKKNKGPKGQKKPDIKTIIKEINSEDIPEWTLSRDYFENKKAQLAEALIKCKGKVTHTCDMIGISYCTFYKWVAIHPEIKEMMRIALEITDFYVLEKNVDALDRLDDSSALDNWTECRLGKFGLSKKHHYLDMKKKFGVLKSAGDVDKAFNLMLAGLENREISMETAFTLNSMLENKRKTIDTRDLELRIQKLEEIKDEMLEQKK